MAAKRGRNLRGVRDQNRSLVEQVDGTFTGEKIV
jgi:hypothetical protein